MRLSIPALTRYAIVFLFVTFAAAAASAQPQPQVVSDSAAADAVQTVLFVEGRDFASNAAVYLGGVSLGGVVVNRAGTALTATITGTLPGSYQLDIQWPGDNAERALRGDARAHRRVGRARAAG